MRSKAIKIRLTLPSHIAVLKNMFSSLALVIIFVVVPASPSYGIEMKTGYATIIYSQREQLSRFNERISFRDYSYRGRNLIIDTVGNEVGKKLDAIVEKTEIILHMFPRKLKFNVRLLNKDTDVWASYRNRYGALAHYMAFYSPQADTIYISVEDVSLRILAHELAHVIIDKYFCTYSSCVLVPVAVQEELAQFVEYKIVY
jgi:hypothetical protein